MGYLFVRGWLYFCWFFFSFSSSYPPRRLAPQIQLSIAIGAVHSASVLIREEQPLVEVPGPRRADVRLIHPPVAILGVQVPPVVPVFRENVEVVNVRPSHPHHKASDGKREQHWHHRLLDSIRRLHLQYCYEWVTATNQSRTAQSRRELLEPKWLRIVRCWLYDC